MTPKTPTPSNHLPHKPLPLPDRSATTKKERPEDLLFSTHFGSIYRRPLNLDRWDQEH